MTQIIEAIDTLISNQLNTYKDSARIEQDKNNEEDFKKSYRYREVLELIQNCIDEFSTDSDNNNILIKINDNIFEIYNSGTPFLVEGIRSLMIANVSPKKKKAFYKDTGYIGNKGLGFRSVLNWSTNIKILSNNGLAVQFNHNDSNQFYRSNNLYGDFSVFSYPKILDIDKNELDYQLNSYTTKITLTLLPDKVSDVENQLGSIDSNTLLFLPKINTLKIESKDGWKQYTKVSEKENIYEHILIEFRDSFNNTNHEEHRIYELNEKTINNETINIKVSYQKEVDTKNNPLYSFFKLGVNLPIKWKINANLELSEDREKIKKTELNRVILEKMIGFLFKCAENETQQTQTSNFALLESLIPTDGDAFNEDNLSIIIPKALNAKDDSFYFSKFYKENIIQYNLLPLLSNKYCKYIDKPSYFKTDLIKKMGLDEFMQKTIIKEPIPPSITHFLPTSSIVHIDFSTINILLINNIETYLNRVELSLLFFKEFEEVISHLDIDCRSLPNFFQNKDGKTIPNGSIYYPTQTSNLIVPSYVPIDIIEPKVIEIVEKNLMQASGTRFYQTKFGKTFGFLEYTFRPILNRINVELKRQIDITDSMSQYFRFLSSADEEDLKNPNHTFYLLNRKGILVESSKLYFGMEYDNSPIEELYVNSDELFVKELTSADFGKDRLKKLFQVIGVVSEPRLLLANESANTCDPAYIQYIPKTLDGQKLVRPYITGISYNGFEKYPQILSSAKRNNIIKWLLSTINKIDETDSTIDLLWEKKQNSRHINAQPSYFFHKVKTTAWYDFKDKKYSLDHIILYKNLENKVDGFLGVSEEDFFGEALREPKDVRDKFKRIFDIKSDFSKISDRDLYRILTTIGPNDTNGLISKKIYSDIETNKTELDMPGESADKNTFFNHGKIFCYDNTFHDLVVTDSKKKVFYANKYVIKAIEKQRNLMFYSRRKNSAIIKNWFNVDLLDQNITVLSHSINGDIEKEFENEIDNIKKYVLAIRINESTTDDTKKSAKSRNNFSVFPCVSIHNSENIQLDDFEFCKFGNDYYINIPNKFTKLDNIRKNSRYCSAISEIFQTAHDLKDDFRDKISKLIPFDEQNRHEQFKVEYNNESLLDEAGLINITNYESIMAVFSKLSIIITDEEKQTINEINIDDFKIEREHDLISIKKILDRNKKSIEDFNEIGKVFLDYTLINRANFEKFSKNNENKFLSFLLNEDKLNVDNFNSERNRYHEYCLDYKPPQNHEYNVEWAYIEYFEIDNIKWSQTLSTDFDLLRESNLKGYDPEKLIKIKENFSLSEISMYATFGKIDVLYNRLNQKHPINQNGVSETEVNYTELYKYIDNQPLCPNNTDDFENGEVNETKQKKPGSPTGATYDIDNNTKQKIGFIAEVEALKYLISEFANEIVQIEWISGNAKKAQKILRGDDTLGYDVRIRLASGEYNYYEIKGSEKDFQSIEISTNEIVFGEKHPKDFFVIFVKVEIEKKKAIFVKNLGNIFDYIEGQSFRSNIKFTAKPKSHTLYFKAKQKL